MEKPKITTPETQSGFGERMASRERKEMIPRLKFDEMTSEQRASFEGALNTFALGTERIAPGLVGGLIPDPFADNQEQ